MALYEGETLAERRQRGTAPWRDSADMVLQAARGLTHAHRQGVIHCDVKPSNLFLTRDGFIKVLDFGIARLLRETRDDGASAATMGTARYMAPEQLRGEPLDARTDVWSLGAVLYELLAGRPAFAAETTASLLEAIFTAEPPRLNRLRPDVPGRLVEMLSLMLAKPREKRLASMDLVVERLESLLASVPGGPGSRAADPEAHALYLRGRSMLMLAPTEALTQFHAALALDERLAEAACGLAEAHLLRGMRGLAEPREEWESTARAASAALELDPECGVAHAFRAAALAVGDHDWEEAQEEFERALAFTPADSTIRSYYAACCLLPLGLREEAVADLTGCVESEPYAPLPRTVLALAHWLGGDMYEASRHAATALVQSPGSPEPVLLLALTQLGSLTALTPLLEALPEPALRTALLAVEAGRAGNQVLARTLAEGLARLAAERSILPSRLAWAWLAAGEPDRALAHLVETIEKREFVSVFLPASGLLRPLQKYPAYQRMLRELNLS
jgi:tetratricopeptide (TPR) repeat protein